VLCVIKKKLWVIAGAVGVSSLAVLPAITAQAHPADTPLAVSATYTGTGNAYVIKVTNADPHCTVRLLIGSVKQNFAVDPDGTVTTPPIDIGIGAEPGTRVIYAKTVAGTGTCEHKETASTRVATYTLRTDKGGGHVFATLGEKITIKALGWDPRSKVTIEIYEEDSDAPPVKRTQRTPNKSGNVFWKVTLPHFGDFVVVATQGTGPDTKINKFELTIQEKQEH
jgi:hypothetical protein